MLVHARAPAQRQNSPSVQVYNAYLYFSSLFPPLHSFSAQAQQAKRTQRLPYLPNYAADLTNQIITEVRQLDLTNGALIAEAAARDRAENPEEYEEEEVDDDEDEDSRAGRRRPGFDPRNDPATGCALLVNHLSMLWSKRCLLAYANVRLERLEELAWNGYDLLDETRFGGGGGDIGANGGAGGMSSTSNLGGSANTGSSLSSSSAGAGAPSTSATKPLSGKQNEATSQSIAISNALSQTLSNLSPEESEYVRRFSELVSRFQAGGSIYGGTPYFSETSTDGYSEPPRILPPRWTDIDITGPLTPPKDLFVDVRVLRDAGEVQTEFGSITLTKGSQFFVKRSDVERLVQQGYLQKLN